MKAKLSLLSLVGALPKSITDDETGKDLISFHPHGVRMGWCMWPENFDPVWVTCNFDIQKAQEIYNQQ